MRACVRARAAFFACSSSYLVNSIAQYITYTHTQLVRKKTNERPDERPIERPAPPPPQPPYPAPHPHPHPPQTTLDCDNPRGGRTLSPLTNTICKTNSRRHRTLRLKQAVLRSPLPSAERRRGGPIIKTIKTMEGCIRINTAGVQMGDRVSD